RRRALTLLGAGGVAITAAACDSGSKNATKVTGSTTTSRLTSSTTPSGAAATTTTAAAPIAAAAAAAAATCTLTPEMTEGPYYISGEAVRSDITEGRPGTPLRLA